MGYLEDIRDRYKNRHAEFTKNKEFIESLFKNTYDKSHKIVAIGNSSYYFYMRVYESDTIEYYEKAVDYLEQAIASQETYIEKLKSDQNNIKRKQKVL